MSQKKQNGGVGEYGRSVVNGITGVNGWLWQMAASRCGAQIGRLVGLGCSRLGQNRIGNESAKREEKFAVSCKVAMVFSFASE